MDTNHAIMASRRNQDRIAALTDAQLYVNSARRRLVRIGQLLQAEIMQGGSGAKWDEELALCRRQLDIAQRRMMEVGDA